MKDPPEATCDIVPRETSKAFPADFIVPPRTAAGFKGSPERPARGTKVVGTPRLRNRRTSSKTPSFLEKDDFRDFQLAKRFPPRFVQKRSEPSLQPCRADLLESICSPEPGE